MGRGFKYGLYNCWNCLCEVCTRFNCPKNYKWYSMYLHCEKMRNRESCPVYKCDFFEHKEIHKRYRLVRRYKYHDAITDKLDMILKRLDDLEGKG